MQDRTVTYTGSVSAWQDVFPDCNSDCLNSYRYLIVEFDTPKFANSPQEISLHVRFDGSFDRLLSIPLNYPFAVYELPFNGTPNSYLSFSGNFDFSSSGNGVLSATFTLSDHYQSGIIPSGSLNITENGSYDVSNYAEAVVDVPASSGFDYHDDLVMINNSILVCGAVCLLIYFFYCIYRMIIKPLGGR